MALSLSKLRLVAVGGGTGLATLLRGIKGYVRRHDEDEEAPLDLSSFTAIVTVSDDAGATGKLIDEFGILPPGDIRACLAALADEEVLLSKLFLHKFVGGGAFGGQSFGNLFLTALIQMNDGDYLNAIKDASRVLRAEGTILPATLERVRLCAEIEGGRVLVGEDELNRNGGRISRVYLARRENGDGPPEEVACEPMPGAVEAIQDADVVILGPGGLYTSIIPNLLVKGISESIKLANCRTIYIANVMTQPGKTDGYSLSDHIREIKKYGGFPVDYVLVNDREVSPAVLATYEQEGATQILFDPEESDKVSAVSFGGGRELLVVEGSIIHTADVIAEVEEQSIRQEAGAGDVETKTVLRHDPAKLTAALIEVLKATQS
ncbi:MAG: uridine diphosphate-N-acetylglucosamine-binding protein YvcK [candidate division Zixibacteria bacterium]|nr:uridine diphosphate-N-acetylglucosamine-binding protein YvcK [candidate division Zixibacteria bacterium]